MTRDGLPICGQAKQQVLFLQPGAQELSFSEYSLYAIAVHLNFLRK
jgi:hypothetical protein